MLAKLIAVDQGILLLFVILYELQVQAVKYLY